jgi:hypothetical protein
MTAKREESISRHAVSRRGLFSAAVVGGAAGLVLGSEGTAAATNPSLILDQDNPDTTAETDLHGPISGDHAVLSMNNNNATSPGNGNHLPDTLRVFADGTQVGAAVFATGGGSGAFQPVSAGAGVDKFAIRGVSTSIGIEGTSVGGSGIGVRGNGASGGTGLSGIVAAGGGTGVLGTANSTNGVGISGQGSFIGVVGGNPGGSPNGAGVVGTSAASHGVRGTGTSTNGVGVRAETQSPTDGFALQTSGPVQFSTAGLATINAGSATVTVTPGVPVRSTSKVLATLQSTGGTLRFVSKDTVNNRFIIHLTGNATAKVSVAYFLIS